MALPHLYKDFLTETHWSIERAGPTRRNHVIIYMPCFTLLWLASNVSVNPVAFLKPLLIHCFSLFISKNCAVLLFYFFMSVPLISWVIWVHPLSVDIKTFTMYSLQSFHWSCLLFWHFLRGNFEREKVFSALEFKPRFLALHASASLGSQVFRSRLSICPFLIFTLDDNVIIIIIIASM